MKTTLILFLSLVFEPLTAKTFQDLGIEDGTYEWLRLNRRGKEETECLPGEKPSVSSTLKGTFSVRQDMLVSTRKQGTCSLTEWVKLLGIDGKLAILQVTSVDVSGCSDAESVDALNLFRPYDDENLSFINAPYKILEMSMVDGFVQFKKKRDQCFYGKKQ